MRLIVLVAALVAVGASLAEASHLKESPRKHRIVYQLNDPGVDKAKFVLGNIQNHVRGVGGWENIEALELVVFGPALKGFVARTMDADVKRALDALQAQGLGLGACGNTMRAFSLTLADLPEGTKPLPQGGVVRVMELQDLGYAYIRP